MLKLLCHPEYATADIHAMAARITPMGKGVLQILYIVDARPGILKLPDHLAQQMDGLWKYTCFEAFFRRNDSVDKSYIEFNFSPSGAWAVYHFDRYRAGMRSLELAAPRIDCVEQEGRYSVEILLELPELYRSENLSCNLTAVLEEVNGQESYWALHHPDGVPDFHNADCFVHEFCADETA